MKKILGGLLLAFVFAVPQAYAGIVSTDQAAAQQERERVKALIERPPRIHQEIFHARAARLAGERFNVRVDLLAVLLLGVIGLVGYFVFLR